MKRIYTLLALIVALSFSAKAQSTRDVNLQLIHAFISDTLVVDTPNVNDTFYVQYGVVNLGPDTLQNNDTVLIWQLSANDIDGYYFFNNLPPGDTFYITPAKFNFEDGPASGPFTWCDSLSVIPVAGDTINDNPGTNNLICTNVYLNNKRTTSIIDAQAVLPSLNLYPNPASDLVTFEFDFGTKAEAILIVRDMTGKAVYTNNLAANKGVQKVEVPVTNLSAGMYMLELSTNAGRSVTRFNVKH